MRYEDYLKLKRFEAEAKAQAAESIYERLDEFLEEAKERKANLRPEDMQDLCLGIVNVFRMNKEIANDMRPEL